MVSDRRKTSVNILLKKDLDALNVYLSEMGFSDYHIVVKDKQVAHILGDGYLGSTDDWKYNKIPISLTHDLTYADWVDLILKLS